MTGAVVVYQLQDQYVTVSQCHTHISQSILATQGARMLRSHTSNNTTVFSPSQAQSKLTSHHPPPTLIKLKDCLNVFQFFTPGLVALQMSGENVTDRTGVLTPLRPLTNPT